MSEKRKPNPKEEAADTFTRRLQRLVRMRSDYREDLNPLGIRLIDRAIEATVTDCIDFGVDKSTISHIFVPQKPIDIVNPLEAESYQGEKSEKEQASMGIKEPQKPIDPIVTPREVKVTKESIAEARNSFQVRLKRLVGMRVSYENDFNPFGIRLVERSIEATFGDFVSAGGSYEDAFAYIQKHLPHVAAKFKKSTSENQDR
jgi:hypothetical protein